MYSQYVEVSDLLQQEKDETARLKQYLDQILKVIGIFHPLVESTNHTCQVCLFAKLEKKVST